MDEGLFTLQQVDYIVSELWVCGIPSIKHRIQSILSVRGSSGLSSVREVMKEYYEQLLQSDTTDPPPTQDDWMDRLKTVINDLV